MYRKFSSFRELTDDFASRSGIAVRYSEDEECIRELSYAELAVLIDKEAERLKAGADCGNAGVGKASVSNNKVSKEHFIASDCEGDCAYVDVIRTEQSVDTIVSIFAHAIAGRDAILADPMIPDEALSAAVAAAKADKAARFKLSDAVSSGSGAKADAGAAEGELLFFTSGTTSRSKIVRLTSGSLCTSAWSGQSMLACGEDDLLLSILPLSHVFGFVCSMLWGLAYGAAIALGRGVRHLIDDALFFRPTVIPAVPSLVGAMLRFDSLNPEVRTALIGAAPCTPEVTAALRSKGIDVYLGYGLTETSSGIAITQDLDEPDAIYPCPGADIRLEPDGEITVATPCMMQGYVGMGQLPEGYRFHTGDLGWFDDKGRLHLKGRKKDVLLMADGTKIFCPEYEEDLAKLTGVSELALAERNGRAVLIAGPGNDRASLLDAVSEYNRGIERSRQIYDVLISEKELPRTATGKLKRYELQDLL